MPSTNSTARPRNAPRYRVRANGDNAAYLTVRCVDGEPITIRYWTPLAGGYVRETTEQRPGTLGFQVCRGLAHTGSALHRSAGDSLAEIIRREARSKWGRVRIDALASAPF